jgi:membrane dipeptidase
MTVRGGTTCDARLVSVSRELQPIADLHNDLLIELAFRADEERPYERYWKPELEDGGVELQVCPVYVERRHLPDNALRSALAQASAFHRAVNDDPGTLQVRSRHDLEKSCRRLVLALEGLEALGDDLVLLDAFWNLGFLIYGLTWNRGNAFAGGLVDERDEGLSGKGKALLDELADRGGAIDLAHASALTFKQVLERAPSGSALVSHAGCRTVHDHRRNLSDDQLRLLAEHGGVLGVMLLPMSVGDSDASIELAVEHVVHALSVMGERAVAIGGDFIRQVYRSGAVADSPDSLLSESTTMDAAIPGLSGPAEFPAFVDALRARLSPTEVHAVCWENASTFLRGALPP